MRALILLTALVAAPGHAAITGQQQGAVLRIPANASLPYIEDDANTVMHCKGDDQIGSQNYLSSGLDETDSAAWTGTGVAIGSIASAANITLPDGTTGGTKLITTAATNSFGVKQSYTYAGTDYTLSAYVKAGTQSCVALDFTSGGNKGAVFNLSTGAVGFQDTGITGTITADANGWYRISIYGTPTAAVSAPEIYPSGSCTANTRSWTGHGTEYFYVWGMQLEDAGLGDLTRLACSVGGGWSPTPALVSGGLTYSPGYPRGFGQQSTARNYMEGFSSSSYYTLGYSGSDVLDLGAGNFSGCLVYGYTSNGTSQVIFTDGAWGLEADDDGSGNNYAYFFTSNTGNNWTGQPVQVVQGNGVNVFCFGWDPATQTAYSKLNLGTTASQATLGAMASGATSTAHLGKHPSGFAASGVRLYEFWVTTTPWSETTATNIERRVLSMVDSTSKPLTLTRASTATADMVDYLTTDLDSVASFPSGAVRPTKDGILVEPAATNLLTRSEALDDAAWDKNTATITANTGTAPDGNATSDTITTASGAGSDGVDHVIGTLSAARYTFSFYVLGVGSTTSVEAGILEASVGFKAATGTVLSGPASVGTATASNTVKFTGLSTTVWSRVALTLDANASTLNDHYIFIYPKEVTPQGNAVSVRVWGAQFESGTVPTSYIPTAGTSATRAGDQLTVPNPLDTNDDWCIHATLKPEVKWDFYGEFMGLGDVAIGTANSAIFWDATGTISYRIYDSTGTQHDLTASSGLTGNTAHRYSFCNTKAGAMKLYVDGVLDGSTTGATMTAQPSTITLGYIHGSAWWPGYVKDVVVTRSADPVKGY